MTKQNHLVWPVLAHTSVYGHTDACMTLFKKVKEREFSGHKKNIFLDFPQFQKWQVSNSTLIPIQFILFSFVIRYLCRWMQLKNFNKTVCMHIFYLFT